MKKKVLIVEDSADIRAMMKMFVEMNGFKAFTADDGFEAVEKVRQHQPDLILMDLMMPELDGVEATKIIQATADHTELPIIALSAFGSSLHEEALEAGCNEVIKKPFDLEVLQPLLDHYLLRL